MFARLTTLVVAVTAAALVATAALAYSGPGVLTHPTGNHVTCQDFGYAAAGVYASGANGTYSTDHLGNATGFSVTITNYQPGTGQNPATFDFSSTAPIVAVFVKAGSNHNGQNLYTYTPPVSSDAGLESPKPSISHVLFCVAGGTPTAVTVRSFTARRIGSSSVVVRWRTGPDLGVLGYNVFRKAGTGRAKLNHVLVLVTGEKGSRFALLDPYPASTYYLQAVSLSGARTWIASAVVR